MERNRLENKVKIEKAIEHMNERLRYACIATAIDVDVVRMSIQSLEKRIPYKLTQIDKETLTGICKCGRVTEVIDCEYYCKYCGQKVTK
ncbi:hypothetical protein CLSAB_19210 [Clostridium saccharobutylicum]|uniref:hypothetical protein n=1 Tax=Clostridium saccharobutylicum TaxID=169679 RepID=UPI00098BE9BD|nr:hypothetical protein [Clostridium saccharobutylicum]OOM17201.1 hypothetical protein CLSAB_19210 [Clostridium saccharobutylicum]